MGNLVPEKMGLSVWTFSVREQPFAFSNVAIFVFDNVIIGKNPLLEVRYNTYVYTF